MGWLNPLALVICLINIGTNAKTLVNLPTGNSKETLNHKIHLSLSDNELHNIFGTTDHSKLPTYKVVFPSCVDHKARRSSEARNALDDDTPMYLHFKAFGKDFHMQLKRNRDVAPESQVIEHHTKKGIQRLRGKPITISTGKIVQDPDSIVSLDHSAGLRGIISRDGEMYVITKVPNLNDQTSRCSHGAHVIFKKSDLPASHPHHHVSCGNDHSDSDVSEHPKKKEATARKRRSVTSSSSKPKKIMELMVVADKTMIESHNKDFLLAYLLAQTNIVAGLYLDPSMEYPINVVLTRLVLLDTDEFANATSIYDLLSKFRTWQVLNNPTDENDPLHTDNAVLFTKNGCKDGCLVDGIAYVGMCQRYSAQSVVKDRGLMSAITMAHEMGHSLGLDHDGTSGYTNCPDGMNIMASATVSGGHAFRWSKCSSDYIKAKLESSYSECYDDSPVSYPYPMNVSFQLYGEVYDGTKQCQLRYGEQSSHCTDYSKNQCNNLMCVNPSNNACIRSIYPPAHGTWCNPHMWCIHGNCVPDGTTALVPIPIHGGWTEYGEYVPCNSQCGGGVQWRERTCTNPAPKNNGKNCVGESRSFWKTCNMQACPANTKLARQVQCDEIGNNKYYVMDHSNPCKLLCGSTIDNKVYYYGNVKDGTFFDNIGPDICIGGYRREVGCDLMLESGTIPDRCNVCGGDGSTCAYITAKNMNPYPYSGDYEVGIIPKGSINIEVEEMQPTWDFLGVKPGTSNSFCYYIPTWSTTAQCAGTNVVYTMEDYYYKDKITIKGPITEQVRLFYVNYYADSSKGIGWTYFVPTEGNVSTVEYAVSGSWDACTKTCAGGVQYRDVICRRTDDKSRVSLSLCSALTKPATYRSCNTHACPAIWHITEWSACSKSCGNGTRTRFLNCSELRSDQKLHPAENTAPCTAATKPNVILTEVCNAIMCHAEWVTEEWSACNTTCDLGYKTRKLMCNRTNADASVITTNDLECYKRTKPVIIKQCNFDNPCPAWVTLYGNCTKECGGGVQYPHCECRKPTSDLRVDDSLCKAELKPRTLGKSCNTHECDSYEWQTEDGACSVTCGAGNISVSVTCVRVRDRAVFPNELCPNATKPAAVKQCNAGICPEIYKWEKVKGACSVTCGKGLAQDSVSCIWERHNTNVSSLLCEASSKPAVGPPYECSMPKCPETYSWNATYGACSVTCGVGMKHLVVQCVKDSDKSQVVDDSFCAATKPNASSLACNMGECPPTFFWKMFWDECTVLCGTGTKTSYYKCYMNESNSEMDSSFCSGITKPKSVIINCSMPTCHFYWEPTYGECSVSCGSGYKMMLLKCKHNNGSEVDKSKCMEEGLMMPAQKSCTDLAPCLAAGPKSSKAPNYYSLGCWRDDPYQRRLPDYIANYRSSIDWNDMTQTIDKCATEVSRRNQATDNPTNYEFFGIQYYGECWAGDSASATTYYTAHSSVDCYQGTGGRLVNYVYSFGLKATKPIRVPPIVPMGCFDDDLSSPRPMPVYVDNFRDTIDWEKPWNETVSKIVKSCAIATLKRGFKMFGIQHHGECWSGPNVRNTYNEDGISTSCMTGVGDINNYFVYDFAE